MMLKHPSKMGGKYLNKRLVLQEDLGMINAGIKKLNRAVLMIK